MRTRRVIFFSGLTIVLSIGALLVGSGDPLTQSESSVPREFSIAAEPEAVVIRITIREGMTGRRYRHTLFGDGRLLFEETMGQPKPFRSSRLTGDEMVGLLRKAVDAGLLDAQQGDLDLELERESGGQLGPVADAGQVSIELHVTSYLRAGEQMGATSRTFSQPALSRRAQRYPGAHRVVALAELHQAIWKLDPKFAGSDGEGKPK